MTREGLVGSHSTAPRSHGYERDDAAWRRCVSLWTTASIRVAEGQGRERG